MQKVVKQFLFFFFFCSVEYSFSQNNFTLLLQDTILTRINHILSQYDTALVYNISSYWYDNNILKGIGMNKNRLYKIEVKIKKNKKNITFKKAASKRIRKEQYIEQINRINFDSIVIMNNDSLNIRHNHNTKIGYKISDGTHYSILLFIPSVDRALIRQSSMPFSYQKDYPTNDRAYFLDVLKTLFDVHKQKNESNVPR
jgi:hypothetical protein